MRRRIQSVLTVVLTLCMVVSLLSVPALAAETGTEDAPWDISEASGSNNVTAWYEGSDQSGYTIHVTGKGRMTASFRDSAVPWANIRQNIVKVVVDEGVTNVGAYSFNFCRRLSDVLLPEGLTEIGTYAFHATGVKHLVVPASVQTIGRMIATPNTYYEVLGNPTNVNDHAFSTSLVSAVDAATASVLNQKTNVSAIIVLNGGTYGQTDEDLANRAYGLTTPVKDGYTFKGWYRDANFTKACKVSEDGRAIVNINNIYYAKWAEGTEPTEYTVTFNSQGGSAVSSQMVVEGSKASKPADPTRTGYTFGGWFTDPDCTVLWNFDTTITGNLTLYAKWTETILDTPDIPGTPSIPSNPGNPGSSSNPGSSGNPSNPGNPDNLTVPDDSTTTTEIKNDDGSTIVSEKTENGDVSITVTTPNGEIVVDIDMPADIPAVDGGFIDVPSGHYAEAAINQAVSMGLINGVGNSSFGTEEPINRAMVATILCRMAGMDGNEYINIFTDVAPDHYAKDAIAWANKIGIVKGYGNTFAPEAEIRREDIAVMLYRFAKILGLKTDSDLSVLSSFNDNASISDYAKEALAWCVSSGLMNGTGNGSIEPGAFTRRCDAVLLLLRFINLIK